jgi:hypothetical protein
VYYLIHKIWPPVSILSEINPVYIISSGFCKKHQLWLIYRSVFLNVTFLHISHRNRNANPVLPIPVHVLSNTSFLLLRCISLIRPNVNAFGLDTCVVRLCISVRAILAHTAEESGGAAVELACLVCLVFSHE